MLLSVNPKTRFAERKRTEHLQSFGLDERALQDILFKSLDRLFPDDELVLLMQSRSWQEEPDLMGVDKNGNLYLNTNIRNSQEDHEDMLCNAKAAAYFDPWKFKIQRLARGDVIFLYQSSAGIVALGEADGKLQRAAYHGNPEHADEEYFMKFQRFQRVSPPLTAAEIKKLTGVDHVFMSTMFGLDAESGKAIRKFLHDEGRSQG